MLIDQSKDERAGSGLARRVEEMRKKMFDKSHIFRTDQPIDQPTDTTRRTDRALGNLHPQLYMYSIYIYI